MMIYKKPDNWFKYDRTLIPNHTYNALLDREVAATVAIEGYGRHSKAFTAAKEAYEWASHHLDYRHMMFSVDLIRDIHRRIVTPDDKCYPGQIRPAGLNVRVGQSRGAEGGDETMDALETLCSLLNKGQEEIEELYGVFVSPLEFGVMAHYHFAAIHPFSDGNGRTARLLETMVLRHCMPSDGFVEQSRANHYWENQQEYYQALHQSVAGDHDFTPLLKLALSAEIPL